MACLLVLVGAGVPGAAPWALRCALCAALDRVHRRPRTRAEPAPPPATEKTGPTAQGLPDRAAALPGNAPRTPSNAPCTPSTAPRRPSRAARMPGAAP
ncbi:MAG: hypothetical protein WD749_02150 [Phycisphaerales bacterium]